MDCSNLSLEDSHVYINVSVFYQFSYAEFREHYFPFSHYVKLWLTPIWFLIGLLGNTLSFCVWSSARIRRENSSAIYLSNLAIADMGFLVLYLTEYITDLTGSRWYHAVVLCELFYFVHTFSQYYPLMLVLAFTVERWIAICYPFHREKLCNPRRAKWMIVILACVVLLISLPNGLLWRLNPETQQCDADRFSTLFSYLSEIVMSLVLPGCILVFNTLVTVEVRKLSHREGSIKPRASTGGGASQDAARGSVQFRSSTVMLITVSFFFIITTLPAGIFWICQSLVPPGNACLRRDLLHTSLAWQRYFIFQNIKTCVDSILLSHFSCNFILYFITGKMFRNEAMRLMTCARGSATADPALLPRTWSANETELLPRLSVMRGNHTPSRSVRSYK